MLSPVDEPDPELPEPLRSIAERAAVECIPVYAITRILQCPAEQVYTTLRMAQANGTIIAVPRADWAPTGRMADHQPGQPAHMTETEALFRYQQVFRLTKLEAGFMVVLMRHERADKSKLHHVVETQRMSRAQQPDKMELTDPKMVDVMICKLRKKLKTVDARLLIETVWGVGYYLEPAVKAIVTMKLTGSAADAEPQNGRAAAAGQH